MEIYKDYNWLYNLYTMQKKSTIEISKIAGVNSETIRYWIHKFEIEVRPIGGKAPENDSYKNKSWLIEQYVNQKKSVMQIEKEFNINHATVWNWLCKFGIEMRPMWIYHGKSDYKNENWLRNEYEINEKSTTQIAIDQAVDAQTISNWLHIFHIVTRSPSEIWDVPGYRNARVGSNNMMWKGGITPKHELIRASVKYSKWRMYIYQHDNYTCRKCDDNSGGNLEAHHQFSFSTHPKLRFNTANGITFCNKCHTKFHVIFGYGNNSPMQVMKFLLDVI